MSLKLRRTSKDETVEEVIAIRLKTRGKKTRLISFSLVGIFGAALFTLLQLSRRAEFLKNNKSTTSLSSDHEKLKVPTYLIIIKSPRSGSTFLADTLKDDPNIHLNWEPRPKTARKHFENCTDLHLARGANNQAWSCAASFNDYLDPHGRKQHRFEQINALIKDYNATVVVQLRANVVEKAISRNVLWDGLSRQMKSTRNKDPDKAVFTPEISQEIRNYAMSGFKTIRGHVLATEKFMPCSNPPIFIWYEDLVRHCDEMVGKIYSAIDLPLHHSVKKNCGKVHFRNTTYQDTLVQELEKEPKLIPMIDAYKFNMEVDTKAIHEKYKAETKNVIEPDLGRWELWR